MPIEAEMYRVFDEIDTDCSGTIEDHELLVYLLGKQRKDAEISALFSLLDTNEDGHISREEWRAAFPAYTAYLQKRAEAKKTSKKPAKKTTSKKSKKKKESSPLSFPVFLALCYLGYAFITEEEEED